MLYEFAMTPELFGAPSNNGTERLPEILCGMEENGMLANLHKDGWSKHVRERLETLSESSLKADISECLKVLDSRNRLVRHPKSKSGKPVTDQDWLGLAFESHEKIPFNAIILSKELMENCGRECEKFVDVLDRRKLSPLLRRRTLSLAQTKSGYNSALGPVLRHARSLFLIDPHMKTTVPFLKTVELCSELLGRRVQERREGHRIHIHALKKYQDPQGREIDFYLDKWEEELTPLRDNHGHRFQVFLWDNKKESMHDRYILTDQCAISIPGGLDCRGGSTDWSLLDYDVLGRRQQDYNPPTSPFELKGSRIVGPP